MSALVGGRRTKAHLLLCLPKPHNISPFSSSSSLNPYNSHLIAHYFSLLHSSPTCRHLRHLHARLLRTSLYDDVILSSKLVLMYSRRRLLLPDSLAVFRHMPHRNLYSWNILIGEFSRSPFPDEGAALFLQMLRSSEVRPDVFTMPVALRACAAAGETGAAFSTHGMCVKLGADRSLFVASALVFMYVTFGRLSNARVVFDGLPERDSVLWTAMLAGYAQRQEPESGLAVFRKMVEAGVELDGAVMMSLLLVCAQLGRLRHGKSVHAWGLRRCFELGAVILGNALVDMYVKCAAQGYARKAFDEMRERDVISWSSMIVGYGVSSDARAAFVLFGQMLTRGIKPNGVTFLGILSACTHGGGGVELARNWFEGMKGFGVIPGLKHYTCMVDCLGRAGLVEEAERLMGEMPVEADGAVLGTLLGACRVHANVEVGERVARKLISLEPERPENYVVLGNIYAAAGRFDEAAKVWKRMKQRNVSKSPGRSVIMIETGNK